MAETIEGGAYMVGKGENVTWVNADGKEIRKPKHLEPKQEAKAPQKPATTYPYADLLKAGGYDSWEKVSAASDEELSKVDGVGPGRLAEIRAHKP